MNSFQEIDFGVAITGDLPEEEWDDYAVRMQFVCICRVGLFGRF